jgi:hypothetical protein
MPQRKLFKLLKKDNAMKKSLVALTLLAGMTGMNANATLINFDDSSLGGTGVTFDTIDWKPDTSHVTQTDTGNGVVDAQPDLFTEFGNTLLVNFQQGTNIVTPASLAYEMFLDYTLNGQVSLQNVPFFGPMLGVLFNGGSLTLYGDTNKNGTLDNATKHTLGTFSVAGGTCGVSAATGVGSCNVSLRFSATPGYFKVGGTDLSVYGAVNSYSSLIVTVQGISGFSPLYTGANASQNFTITHDGNQTFTISEPATVAALGLGLLGLGFSRRNKKQA